MPHIYAAGDVSGKLPLSSVAAMQGRKVAERVMGLHTGPHRHLDYDKAASAIFTEPEIADVGLAEAEAFAAGRKIRVTKVPFSATAKALINNNPQGFVKIVSDPATGVVLGGSIVGRHAAELISVIALAVTANLKVTDIVESLLVHPALSEALAEASEYGFSSGLCGSVAALGYGCLALNERCRTALSVAPGALGVLWPQIRDDSSSSPSSGPRSRRRQRPDCRDLWCRKVGQR